MTKKKILVMVNEDFEYPSGLENVSCDFMERLLLFAVNVQKDISILANASVTEQLLQEREDYIQEQINKIKKIEQQKNIELVHKFNEQRERVVMLEHDRDIYDSIVRDKNKMIEQMQSMIDGKLDNLITSFSNLKLPSSNSSLVARGDFGERNVETMIQLMFPSCEIIDVSSKSEHGDLRMIIESKTLFIEVKNKNKTTKDDILKFERDIRSCFSECEAFLFVTSSSTIPSIGECHFTVIEGKPVLYLSQIFDYPTIMKFGISTLCSVIDVFQLVNNIDTNEHQSIENLYNDLNTVLRHSYNHIELFRSITKTLQNTINTLQKECDTINEQIVLSLHDLERVVQLNASKCTINVNNKISSKLSDPYFDVLYTIKQKYVKISHKELLQKAVDEGQLNIGVDRLSKLWPKYKFDKFYKSWT